MDKVVQELNGKTIRMRLVKESDAEFIIRLRCDEKYNKHLSSVGSDVHEQREWIRRYKKDESENKQFYFIIERMDGIACGTVRLYDFKKDSFCWGSWILNEEKTKYAAIESAFLVYKFGFGFLGYKKSHFDVRKENHKVISFHKKMGAIEIAEDDLNCYFEITKEMVNEKKEILKGKF